MTETIQREVTLVTTTCPNCGVTYAVPEHFLDSRCQDGKSFFCPSGHSASFHETEAKRLAKLLAAEQQRLVQERAAHDQSKARAREAERSAELSRRSAKTAKTIARKLRQRVKAGKCPCCQAAFPNLQEHMAEKHPHYGTKATK